MWNEFDKIVTQFMNLQQQANQYHGNCTHKEGHQTSWSYPQTAIRREGNELHFTAEIPGVKKEDLTLEIKGNQLHLQGTKKVINQEGEKTLHRERANADFNQSYKLPFAVDPEKTKALYENGVLEVTLQRAEDDKPQTIEIN